MSAQPPKLDDLPPPTPAHEWADQAKAAFLPPPPAQTPGISGGLPLDSAASTPGRDLPGAYPGDPIPNPSIYPQANASNTDSERPGYERTPSGGYKDVIHNSATAYIAPERLDQVEHLVEGVGSKAAAYVPAGVASVVSGYWCELKLVYRRRLSAAAAARTRSDIIDGPQDPKKLGKAWRTVGWLIVGLAWMLGFDLWGRHPYTKGRASGEDCFSFPLLFLS